MKNTDKHDKLFPMCLKLREVSDYPYFLNSILRVKVEFILKFTSNLFSGKTSLNKLPHSIKDIAS